MAVRNLTTKARRRRASRRTKRRSARSPDRHAAPDMAGLREHLEGLERGLNLVMAVVIVAVEALKSTNVDHEPEVAKVLRRYAGDRLYVHIETIQTLLRRLVPEKG